MRSKFLFALCILLILGCAQAWATHNRGGEISYRHISGFLYEFTVVTYTKFPSPADRPSLPIKWGDQKTDTIFRTSQTVVSAQPAIQKNTYVARHNYSGAGNFTISLEDPNRNGNIINIPNSLNTPFYIETALVINPFLTPNNSVVLLNPPIDNGCVNQFFIHNPNAFDPDGDSLSYALVPCRGFNGLPVSNYGTPQASSFFRIDSLNGNVLWQNPVIVGEYNIAIKIYEWRQGIVVGSVTRDLQIDIQNCSNNPPQIAATNDTCIMAGQRLYLQVSATDPDLDNIILSANGAPFEMPNVAIFTQTTNTSGAATGTFEWTPNCNQIRKQRYQVIFRAKDVNNPSLVDLQTWQIKVIAPPPILTTASSQGGKITLNWQPYNCIIPTMRGFKIYRKQNLGTISNSNCQTGLPPNTGYELIDTLMRTSATSYQDTNNGAGLASGATYCYVVTAFFSEQDFYVYDGTESPASNQLCNTVKRDMPTLTQADIQTTSSSNGKIALKWLRPTQLDSTQFLPPYKLELYRTPALQNNNTSRQKIATYRASSYYLLQNTSFLDSLQNTDQNPYSYQIEMYFGADSQKVGIAKSSSTLRLSALPLPNALRLSWQYNTAWQNDSFVVYKKNSLNVFDSVATVYTNFYRDENLNNGQTYCYFVKSIGHLTINSGDVLVTQNKSQQICASPKDTIPPLAPLFWVAPNCENIQNALTWRYNLATNGSDLAGFELYFKPKLSDNFLLLTKFLPSDSSFLHELLAQNSLAGCYQLVAVDSTGNRSATDTICVDNCADKYLLPDIFTPNGDAFNEIFEPFSGYKFVQSVAFVAYNRWGQVVFRTTKPEIGWTGGDASAGVYYYTCVINYITLEGIKARTIHGNIRLVK